jgi:hypothetical protein
MKMANPFSFEKPLCGMNTGSRIKGGKRTVSSAIEYWIMIPLWEKYARAMRHGVEEKGL